jgi:hypothetical protein
MPGRLSGFGLEKAGDDGLAILAELGVDTPPG